MKLTALRFAAAALTAFAMAGAALAQGYPSRPVRLIVPYPPGGTTDMIARLYADKLSSRLSANVIVENKPGAATNIGSDVVARATADGYTLLFSASGSTSSTVFGPTPTFDPLKDFQPISMISELPFVIAANPKAAFTTWPELVAMARKNPGKYTIASAQLDVYVELLRSRADVDILHVPYKGGAQSATDAIAGQVDMAFALVPVVLPHVESGSLRALATTAGQRSERLPDVPTLVELGIDYDVTSWYALTGPAGLPPEIVTRLSQATREAVTDPDFIAKLEDIGAIAIASSPQELDARIRAQLAVWQNIATQFPKLVKTQ